MVVAGAYEKARNYCSQRTGKQASHRVSVQWYPLDQTLIALYASDLNGSENSQPETGFFSILRNIEVPEALSIPVPIPSSVAGESTPASVPTAEATPMPSVTSTPQPLSTSTVAAANNFESGQQIPSNSEQQQ